MGAFDFFGRAEAAKECSICRRVVITTSNAGTGVPLIFEMGHAALLALPAAKAEQGMVWTLIQCQSGMHAHTHTWTCMTAHEHYPMEIAIVLTYMLSGKRASLQFHHKVLDESQAHSNIQQALAVTLSCSSPSNKRQHHSLLLIMQNLQKNTVLTSSPEMSQGDSHLYNAPGSDAAPGAVALYHRQGTRCTHLP